MTQTIDADQKELTAAWDKRCWKVQLKYVAVLFPTTFLLFLPFSVALFYFIDIVSPLMSGELVYGLPGYYEYQEAKDDALIFMAVLGVLYATALYLMYRWYKKMMRALGPRPGGYPGKWKRWLCAE